ncbi:hypothetical protein F443_15955 [Plasmopara halstedii]|uniref:t-SNARE coiled-coil homology domain-containing protein n=1 Tax=Plasmopara halstedii TaxID=4781 RepID=A0A0N7L733_PLAHL|nr:hypothetical protein F443_15955 [Plasmopara halstedii]CEG45955.1 hypothetical protein F443_15955 [Plasmopara halstedii]|eukprot:XP_024582324.1 hypothetical protein F443_15955 [Plasmopara halstedii]
MDRTCDFVSITVLFATGQSRPHTHRPLSRDARLAQQISDQLRQQELCLRELQDIVIKKSIIGDDQSAQIATLTDVLKKELGAAERSIESFWQKVKAQRGSHQQHNQAHFAIVCQSLKSRCAKSVQAFHQALQQHTAAIRERSSRRSKFSHGGGNLMVHINAPLFFRTNATFNGHPVLPTNSKAPQHLLQNRPSCNFAVRSGFQALTAASLAEQSATPTLSPPPPEAKLRRRANFGASPIMQQRLAPPENVTGMQSQQYRSHEDAQTRHANAAQVESTIVEITNMYTRMASMVAQQGEIISRIDDDIHIAQTNVEAAHDELLKLFNMVQSNRSLIVKIFLVLVVVIFLFVVIF